MNLTSKKVTQLSLAIATGMTAVFATSPSFAQTSDQIQCAQFLMEDNRTYRFEPTDKDHFYDVVYYTIPSHIPASVVEDQNDVELRDVGGIHDGEGNYHTDDTYDDADQTLTVFLGLTRQQALSRCS